MRTRVFSLIIAVVIAGEQSLAASALLSPASSLSAEEARIASHNYVSTNTAYKMVSLDSKGKFPADEKVFPMFKEVERKSLDEALVKVFEDHEYSDLQKRELKALFYHLWAMFKLAKNGYPKAAALEHVLIAQEVMAYTENFLLPMTQEEFEAEWLRIIPELVDAIQPFLGSLSPAESDRVIATTKNLSMTFGQKNLHEASTPLVVPSLGAGSGAVKLLGIVASMAGPGGYTLVTLSKAVGDNPSFLQVLSVMSAFVLAGAASAYLTFVVLPPKSYFARSRFFREKELSEIFQEDRCVPMIDALLYGSGQ